MPALQFCVLSMSRQIKHSQNHCSSAVSVPAYLLLTQVRSSKRLDWADGRLPRVARDRCSLEPGNEHLPRLGARQLPLPIRQKLSGSSHLGAL
jgi:hypothetical protein